ncbi:hypothetical protein [Zoogloea sp.]|uniref:hypothetical protein n=1 Tax=Zoogloea sp. TaxID=49181 RepID=UPI0035B1231E
MGLATDGDPLNWMNCRALNDLLVYEEQYGKRVTLLKFNTLNFSKGMVALDAAFPSIGGKVSIDWMMRIAVAGVTAAPGVSHLVYWQMKLVWNSINRTAPWTNISGEANSNAPVALTYWLSNDVSLRKMFAPALEQCKCISE